VPPELLLSLLLFGVASAWCVSQVVRHVYEASFVLPLVMLAIVLALAAPHGSIRMRHGVAALALGIGPLALLSMLLVAGYYGPPMMEAAKARGILPLQPWSVPVFGYGGERAQMLGLARQCRLPEPAQASLHAKPPATASFGDSGAAHGGQHQRSFGLSAGAGFLGHFAALRRSSASLAGAGAKSRNLLLPKPVRQPISAGAFAATAVNLRMRGARISAPQSDRTWCYDRA